MSNRYNSLEPNDPDDPQDADTPGTELTAEEVVQAKAALAYTKWMRDHAKRTAKQKDFDSFQAQLDEFNKQIS